jgi:tripartite-type tricarboxylate transporter receptor subunit TctC
MAAERVTMLRKAFDDTMADAAFLDEANKQGLTVDAITGQELADLIAAVYKTPSEVVKRTGEALGRISKDDKPN